MKCWWRGAVGAALAISVSACSPYALRGKVIEGQGSYVTIVDASDPRLAEPGLSGAAVTLVLDPTQLNRKTLASGISGADGEVSLKVDEFGAGMLEYDVGVYARRRGREPAEGYFRLPGSSQRVLISLAPGEDRENAPSNHDPYGDVDRFWDGRR